MKKYQAMFRAHVEDDWLAEIRNGLNRGMALGSAKFKEEVEKLTGRRVKPQKKGRPVGWRKKKKKG